MHFGFLDGIRGLLALWVLLYHLWVAVIGQSTPWGGGDLAVDLFMVISGLLMAFHWQERKHDFLSLQNQTIDFYLRRFFRVAPVYYFLLVFAWLGNSIFFDMRAYIKTEVVPPWGSGEMLAAPEIDVPNVIAHLTFLFGFFPKYSTANILPDWSIGLEMQFYMFFPLIIILFNWNRTVAALACVAIAFAANRYIDAYALPTFLPLKLDLFAAGILIGLRKPATLLLLIPCLYGDAKQVWIVAAFMALMVNYRIDILDKILSNKMGRFLGDTSYGVYLSHIPIYVPIVYLLLHQDWFMAMDNYTKLATSLVIILPIVYGFSYLLHITIERFGIKTGKSILRRLNLKNSNRLVELPH